MKTKKRRINTEVLLNVGLSISVILMIFSIILLIATPKEKTKTIDVNAIIKADVINNYGDVTSNEINISTYKPDGEIDSFYATWYEKQVASNAYGETIEFNFWHCRKYDENLNFVDESYGNNETESMLKFAALSQ